MSHSRWKTLRERTLAEGFTEPEDVAEARRAIRMSMPLAKAVYDRRIELGLTQTELADRAGLTQTCRRSYSVTLFQSREDIGVDLRDGPPACRRTTRRLRTEPGWPRAVDM